MEGHIVSHQHDRKWWKEAAIYQIYPASFLDSNSDGIGDIPGIISKLPYLASLGIDAIWLSPHYASPQVDMGYDISDFEDIYPPYGTLEDCKRLIAACHSHGLKLIFDLVINHTSDQHQWFKESRSSKSNPKRDWYIWRAPRGFNEDGTPIPPNNWRSNFSVPAWTFDSQTQEYYLNLYATEMPDLNWENEEARKAIYESSMHFWLRNGIDGFRIDTVNKYSKPQNFPDAPITDPSQFTQPAQELYSNGPRMHEFLAEMHELMAQYSAHGGGEIMTVGELPNTPHEDDVLAYVSASAKQMDMVFNFDTVQLGQTTGDRLKPEPYTNEDFKRNLSTWQKFVNGKDAWTTVFLENHDQGRSISRFGCDETEELRTRSGKLLAIILGTMTGTLFLYQGQEIGMTNIPYSWPLEEYIDVRSVNYVQDLKSKGASQTKLDEARKNMTKVARDNARLPFQWDSSPNAGFSSSDAKPWMRVHDHYSSINLKDQESNPDSLLAFWRNMLQLRKEFKDHFIYGVFQYIETGDPDVFAFIKTSQTGKEIMTVANMSKENKTFTGLSPGKWVQLIANVDSQDDNAKLRPWEARVSVKQ